MISEFYSFEIQILYQERSWLTPNNFGYTLFKLLTSVYCQRCRLFEPCHGISNNNVVCATSKASDQPAHTRSLIRAFAIRFRLYDGSYLKTYL